jgi:hypothetical protein
MSAQRKRGLTIHSKEKNTIAVVRKCCDEESEQKYLTVRITTAIVYCCKLLQYIIKNSRNESYNCVVGGGLSTTPGKHGNVQMSEM